MERTDRQVRIVVGRPLKMDLSRRVLVEHQNKVEKGGDGKKIKEGKRGHMGGSKHRKKRWSEMRHHNDTPSSSLHKEARKGEQRRFERTRMSKTMDVELYECM